MEDKRELNFYELKSKILGDSVARTLDEKERIFITNILDFGYSAGRFEERGGDRTVRFRKAYEAMRRWVKWKK